MIFFAAIIANTTGLFPASFYHDTTIHNAKIKVINLLVLLLFATAVYLMAEYAIFKQIAARSNVSAIWAPPRKYIIFMSYLYFIIFSFLIFLFTLHFISKNIFVIGILSTLLNIIPIYLIYSIMLDELQIKNMKAIFWLTTVVMSIATVYPFGLIPFVRLFLL